VCHILPTAQIPHDDDEFTQISSPESDLVTTLHEQTLQMCSVILLHSSKEKLDSLLRRWNKACEKRNSLVEKMMKSYAELKSVQKLIENMQSDVSSPVFQDVLCQYILNPVLLLYPPSIDYKIRFCRQIQSVVEKNDEEVHPLIIDEVMNLIKRQSTYKEEEWSYWTTFFTLNNQSHHITLRLQKCFSSSTGMVIWPASQQMGEFILSNRQLFNNRRVLELGSGLGLTALCLLKCKPAFVCASDCDAQALRNLEHNLEINKAKRSAECAYPSKAICSEVEVGSKLQTRMYKWNEPDKDDFIAEAGCDLLISCDTIYDPNDHFDLLSVVKKFLWFNSASECYFAQTKRDPSTWQHFLATAQTLSIRIEMLNSNCYSQLFDYDRQHCILMRFCLRL